MYQATIKDITRIGRCEEARMWSVKIMLYFLYELRIAQSHAPHTHTKSHAPVTYVSAT